MQKVKIQIPHKNWMLESVCAGWGLGDGTTQSCPPVDASDSGNCYATNCQWSNFTAGEQLTELQTHCNWEHLYQAGEQTAALNANCNWEHLTGCTDGSVCGAGGSNRCLDNTICWSEQLEVLNANCNFKMQSKFLKCKLQF